jgi:hypothetical protein
MNKKSVCKISIELVDGQLELGYKVNKVKPMELVAIVVSGIIGIFEDIDERRAEDLARRVADGIIKYYNSTEKEEKEENEENDKGGEREDENIQAN